MSNEVNIFSHTNFLGVFYRMIAELIKFFTTFSNRAALARWDLTCGGAAHFCIGFLACATSSLASASLILCTIVRYIINFYI